MENEMTVVQVPGVKFNTSISIKPYVDPTSENMGLEKYQVSLHDRVVHTEQLACIEKNGTKRYLTGLNEFAPEVVSISDPDEKKARIKAIRKTVADLEQRLASNVIDPEDEKFWDKVELVKPSNSEFWDKIELKIGNEEKFLSPQEDPFDLIYIMAIKAGGFSIVAKSFEDAKKSSVTPKFYLNADDETLHSKTYYKKIKNKAVSKLQELFDKDPKKLLYVTKVIEPASPQFKLGTSSEKLYDVMDEYIAGNAHEKSSIKAAKYFTATADQSKQDLKIRAIVKDATFLRLINVKKDGYIYDDATGSMMGKNVAEIVEFFKDPMNEDVVKSILDKVESNWKN